MMFAPTATKPSPALAIREKSANAHESNVFFIMFGVKLILKCILACKFSVFIFPFKIKVDKSLYFIAKFHIFAHKM